jgi:DinB superfamily
VPFRYYARLSRAQKATYAKSDGVPQLRLRRAEEVRPLVRALEVALGSESRERTQAASDHLIRGLTDALGIQAVRVEVLAARPHARWGELHGLYEAPRGTRPTITLWMRTAKQRRVVAFRTFLRTLLHEVGHHVDYTLLKLPDSFHTEGFYKRESSLFHQLVPAEGDAMPTIEDVAKQPIEQQLARLGRTAHDLAEAIRGQADAALSRRPDPKNWAATEVLCHLRDTEESFMGRFHTILAMDEPKLFPIDPDRWADERQYLRADPEHALRAFRRRREESLGLLRGLAAEAWNRGAIHPVKGRMTVREFVTLMAWHDDNHVDQLKRALEGRA